MTNGWPTALQWPRCSNAARPCRSLMRSGTQSPAARLPCGSSTIENSSKQRTSHDQRRKYPDAGDHQGQGRHSDAAGSCPGHVARIKELVRDGFYDGVAFHRVIDGFMAQTGCPHGTGTGGSGKKLKAEFNSE